MPMVNVTMGSFHVTMRQADGSCDVSKCQDCKATCLDRLGKWYDKQHLMYKVDAVRYPFKEGDLACGS